jgi:hypothetical protein
VKPRNENINAPEIARGTDPAEDNEWIPEALELCGEHEIDQNRRQQESPEEFAALHAKLTRLTGVVDGRTLRKNLLRFAFQVRQCLIERNLRWKHTLHAHGVQLLKLLQLTRLRCGAEGGECR